MYITLYNVPLKKNGSWLADLPFGFRKAFMFSLNESPWQKIDVHRLRVWRFIAYREEWRGIYSADEKKHLNTTASSQREAYDINVWTQMTLVLVGKGLVLGDWPSRLEVIGAPGTYYNSIAFNHIFVLASRELSRWEAYMSPFSFTASHQQTLATSTAVKAASITPIVKFLPHHFLPLVRSPTTASNVASLWLRIRRVI